MLYLKKLTVYDYMLGMLAVLLVYNASFIGYGEIALHLGAVLLVGLASDYIFKLLVFKKGNVSKSTVVTSFIVAALISPPNVVIPTVAVMLAMLSKNLLKVSGRHVFNPANFGILLAALIFPTIAQSWWAAEPAWLVLILGLAVAYKLNRWIVPVAFLASYVLAGVLVNGFSLAPIISLYSGLTLFFALVMISEPLTMPFKRNGRIVFGTIVGVLAVLLVYVSPALSILGSLAVGNLLVPVLNKYVK